jgi:hypothetical protein
VKFTYDSKAGELQLNDIAKTSSRVIPTGTQLTSVLENLRSSGFVTARFELMRGEIYRLSISLFLN